MGRRKDTEGIFNYIATAWCKKCRKKTIHTFTGRGHHKRFCNICNEDAEIKRPLTNPLNTKKEVFVMENPQRIAVVETTKPLSRKEPLNDREVRKKRKVLVQGLIE